MKPKTLRDVDPDHKYSYAVIAPDGTITRNGKEISEKKLNKLRKSKKHSLTTYTVRPKVTDGEDVDEVGNLHTDGGEDEEKGFEKICEN